MLNARSIQSLAALIIGGFLAIWLGLALVTNQSETVIKIAGAAVLLAGAFLGQRVWLLMIFFTGLNVVLSRGMGTTDLGQALFIVYAVLLFLMRKLRFEVRVGELEIWSLLIIASVLQVYIRNPVGLYVMGGDTVGGRPYVILALSISSALLLSTLRVSAKELKWAMTLTLIGGLLGPLGQMLRSGSFNALSSSSARIPVLGVFGTMLARWITSRISPLRACLHPGWAFLILISLAMAAGSGYRISIANIGFIYLIAIFYYRGLSGLLGSLILGAFAITLLSLINLNFPLHRNIQRALSPFPGTWDERITADADASTEWRVDMWKVALTSDEWIKNKTLGDGLGMSREQLGRNMDIDAGAARGYSNSGLNRQQENILIAGNYHSGPVQTIRTVGYVGLLIFLLAMIRLAVHAHRQIERCRGTEWFPFALFFCIPMISHPIYFVFIFGEYANGVATTMAGIAMVRLMERNLPLPAYVVKRRHAHVPLAVRNRPGGLQNARGA